MATIEELQQAVGELMKVDVQAVEVSTVLGGLLASSMGRARLDATLRSRHGITNPGVYTVRTFGELCQVLGLDGAGQASITEMRRPSVAVADFSNSGIAVGIDIQGIEELPEQADYWEGDFYRQHFTQQEIAYALLQPHPRESFAAAWCAKEALRKADNSWLGVSWQLTEVVHDEAGRPSLRSGEQTISCAVSLSHTNGFAIAIVAMVEVPAPIELAPPPAPQESVSAGEGSGGTNWLPLVISVAALVVSLAAAAHVFLR